MTKQEILDAALQLNGIYLVYQDGHSIPFAPDLPASAADGVAGIGVIHDARAFQVALKDLGEFPLIPYDKWKKMEDDDHYTKECDGLHDWDCIAGTKLLMEQGSEIPLPDGWYIPTLAQLDLMCFLKEELNAALSFAGGESLTDSYYWSSAEGYRYFGRNVYFYNGYANNHSKYNSYTVRAVSAFSCEH